MKMFTEDRSNKLYKKILNKSESKASKVTKESQGPIDWKHDGLRAKYRGEREREDAWEAWKEAYSNANSLFIDGEAIISVPKVERHPLYVLFYSLLEKEDKDSLFRTKNRLKMKRFVLDVQELWMTNLQHLREHRPTAVVEPMKPTGNNGLLNRRDVDAIVAYDHQIQSVSVKRSLAKAFVTTALPEPAVVLDYVPSQTPKLLPPPPLPPTIDEVLSRVPISFDSSIIPHSAIQSKYGCMLFLHRLIPSVDYNLHHEEILWRMSILDQSSSLHTSFVYRQMDLLAYQQQFMNSFISRNDVESCRFTMPDVYSIPWQGTQIQCRIDIRLFLHPSIANSLEINGICEHCSVSNLSVLFLSLVEISCTCLDSFSTCECQSCCLLLSDILSLPEITSLIFDKSQAVTSSSWPLPIRLPLCEEIDWTNVIRKDSISILQQNFRDWILDTSNRIVDIWNPLISNLCFHSFASNNENPCPAGLTLSWSDEHHRQKFLRQTLSHFLPFGLHFVGNSFTFAGEDWSLCDLSRAPSSTLSKLPFTPQESSGKWESFVGSISPTLSMIVSQALPRISLVPGSSALGKTGLWWDQSSVARSAIPAARYGIHPLLPSNASNNSNGSNNGTTISSNGSGNGNRNNSLHQNIVTKTNDLAREISEKAPPPFISQVAAKYFRDPHQSTTNSVLVHVSLALEDPLVFLPQIAWEDFQLPPNRAPNEEVLPVVSSYHQPAGILLLTPLESPLEMRLSPCTFVYSSITVEGVDCSPPDIPEKPFGYRRHFLEVTELGFRQKLTWRMMGVDPVLPTVVFGITQQGAQPNAVAILPRNIWHGVLAITENINRPRTPKDYHYIVANTQSHGPNDPAAFSIILNGGEYFGLFSTSLSTYEKKYEEILERRAVFARQLALDSKIEQIQIALRTKEKQLKVKMQKEIQRALEKKLRKATKSEKGWRRRFETSTLLEIQGNWERRRDDRTGMIFFHCLTDPSRRNPHQTEAFLQTCQWEVPPAWDGDPLIVPDLEGNMVPLTTLLAMEGHESGVAGKAPSMGATIAASLTFGMDASQQDPFAQPAEDWLPNKIDVMNQSTPGTMAQPARRAPAHSTLPSITSMKGDNNSNTNNHISSSDSIDSLASQSLVSVNKTALGNNGNNQLVDLRSTGGERSWKESEAPTLGTATLEHWVEQWVASDEIMKILARRLGLDENRIQPVDELQSLFTIEGSSSSPVSVGRKDARGSLNKALITNNNTLTTISEASSTMDGKDDTNRNPLLAPRDFWNEETEEKRGLDDDGDDEFWSDDEQEVGNVDDIDEEVGDLPQDHRDVAFLKRQDYRQRHPDIIKKLEGKKKAHDHDASSLQSVPSQVPYLSLTEAGISSKEASAADQAALAWRRLPRVDLAPTFFQRCTQTRTLGPDYPTRSMPRLSSHNHNHSGNNNGSLQEEDEDKKFEEGNRTCQTFPAPVFLLPISPTEACVYEPENFEFPVEVLFVPDAKKDMERAISTLERNVRREEELSRHIATDDLLLFGEASETTSADRLLARQYQQDQQAFQDPREAAMEKAILAAKSNNIAAMEDALEEDVPIDTIDSFGNSLLILAAQQGSKRMCKFLLRRGAKLNMQNLSGNTCLHYCYAYSHTELGDYLRKRGADDSILNIDGLTCYEGLGADELNIQE